MASSATKAYREVTLYAAGHHPWTGKLEVVRHEGELTSRGFYVRGVSGNVPTVTRGPHVVVPVRAILPAGMAMSEVEAVKLYEQELEEDIHDRTQNLNSRKRLLAEARIERQRLEGDAT